MRIRMHFSGKGERDILKNTKVLADENTSKWKFLERNGIICRKLNSTVKGTKNNFGLKIRLIFLIMRVFSVFAI